MATATTKTVKRGPSRTLGVRTWLGAGALTLGVGAALAGATAVAQADTGGHQTSSSASSSSASKSDAGPKRSSGVASTKRVSAPVTASKSSAAKVKAAKTPSAAQTNTTTQTVNTPFGPITVAISATVPDPGASGAVDLALNASTPLGNAKFGLAGTETFTAPTQQDPTPKAQFALTSGTLHLPAPLALAVSSAGSAVLGAMSVYNSATSFFGALQSGNVVGAAQAWLEGGPKLTNAILFGQQSLTLPIDLGMAGQSAQLSIPFGGFFAPLKPVTVTWGGYSYTDQTTGAEVTIDPVDIEFAGTRFGGVGSAILQLFGLA